MAYERLQGLGEEKFRKIINGLMQGTPAMHMARTIRGEWGDFQDVGEKTLTQQLNRLRKDAAEGMFGKKIAQRIQEGAKPKITLLANSSVDVMEELTDLAVIQRARVQDLVQKEKSSPVLVGALLSAANSVISDYRETLTTIQKIRFDLGLDRYCGIVPTVRGASVTETRPDGSSSQKQLFEAFTTVEEIFNRRKIPQVTDGVGV